VRRLVHRRLHIAAGPSRRSLDTQSACVDADTAAINADSCSRDIHCRTANSDNVARDEHAASAFVCATVIHDRS